MDAPIRLLSLTKDYGKVRAVDRISLDIYEGEVFGLLGPNGAGKTTTLLMLTTVIKPTSGDAYVYGYSITKQPHKVREVTGIAFQEPKLAWINTPWDILIWHAKVCGLSGNKAKETVESVLKDLDMYEVRKKFAHQLSGGQRKRVEIAKVLIQNPKLAIFDEPTSQIDVAGKHKIWDAIRSLTDKGSTIILATNELYEADVLSDRIAIIHKGRLVTCDTSANLKDTIPGGDVIEIQTDVQVDKHMISLLEDLNEIHKIVPLEENKLRIFLNMAERVLPKIVDTFNKNKVKIKSVRMSEPSLDDVFMHYTGMGLEESYREVQRV